jgi:hypothetical protein
MIFSIIKMGSVQLTTMSRGFDSPAKTTSIMRRIQRFFQFQEIALENIAKISFALIPLPKQIILTLDRTNWQFGTKDINFLTLCFVYKGISIPFLWSLLDHKGNSNTTQRVTLLERALKILGDNKIHCLLADREFIGEEWFKNLIKKKIPFCIRILESTLAKNSRGKQIPIKTLCRELKAGESKTLKNKIWGVKVKLTCLRLPSGELLILASPPSFEAPQLPIYTKRWTIECLFKSLKTQGFNLEGTHLKHEQRLSILFALCAIAFAWSVKVGDIKNDMVPIKIKNHGRPLYSLFTYGFHALQGVFFRAYSVVKRSFKKFPDLMDFSTKNLEKIKSVVY